MAPNTTIRAPLEPAEERAAPQLTGRDVFKVLFRRKWIILILFLSTTAFVALNASRIPTEYSAVAKVLLNRGMRNSALDRNISLLTWDETVNSELQIAESQPVVDRAQRILNQRAIEEGVEAIEIDPAMVRSLLLGESNVIGLSYMSLDWNEVRPVANALAQAYVEVHDELFALPDARQFFEEKVAEAEKDLSDLRDRKKQAQEAGSMVRIFTQQDYVIRAISLTGDKLVDVERELEARKTEIEEMRRLFYEEGFDSPFEIAQIEDQAGTLRILTDLRANLARLEQERVELLTRFTDQHPSVVALDERIADLKERVRTEAEQVLLLKEHSLNALRAEAGRLRAEIADLQVQLAVFPEAEREIEALDQAIDVARANYTKLLENRMAIDVATVSSRDYTLTLLSEAGSPVATNPRDPIRLALVPAFSLLVGISLAFFVETMDHSLKSREDVERHVDLPVLTSIPKRKGLNNKA
ncbi:MAG: hypothetical protein FJY73_02035 [Candidatus Eisenbacteria bacterium]|nr:hypothetical protein [Candidatus Eisenbacteria bacterium]